MRCIMFLAEAPPTGGGAMQITSSGCVPRAGSRERVRAPGAGAGVIRPRQAGAERGAELGGAAAGRYPGLAVLVASGGSPCPGIAPGFSSESLLGWDCILILVFLLFQAQPGPC